MYNSKTGYDLYGIAASGPLSCPAAIAVIKALSEQVQRREAAAEPGVDCFPGYCRGVDGRPRRTSVAGYRCRATDSGDVSILFSIVCRDGNRYVSAGAADDE